MGAAGPAPWSGSTREETHQAREEARKTKPRRRAEGRLHEPPNAWQRDKDDQAKPTHARRGPPKAKPRGRAADAERKRKAKARSTYPVLDQRHQVERVTLGAGLEK